jgi:peptide/nickel transport system substrate-binding protein
MTSLGRRSFLGLTAGSAVAGSLFVTTGCDSAVDQAKAGAGAAGTPRRGGRINTGINTDVVPGNFFTNSSAGVTTIVGLAYESLIRYPNDKVEPTPRLATGWELGADGRSLALDLREGVTFHDGRPFTSADVKASIAAYADPLWNGQLKSTAAAISKVDTTDPQRAVLHFDHPLSNVFDLLDTAPIIDSRTLDKIKTGEAFVGTGPFKVTKWTPNTGITFDRHEGYWQPERPYVDGVDTRVIPDPKALLSALRSGQVDYANGLGYRDIDTLTAKGDFAKITWEGAEQQIYVGANVTAGSLKDARVRQAIAYAVDRDRIVTEVLRGAGYAINLPWPKYSPAYDAQANTTYVRDVAKAKALVAEVGQIETIPYTYSSASPLLEATAAIVQSNLAEVGITVELDPVDQAQFVSRLIGAKFAGIWSAFHSWAQYTPSTLSVSAYPFNARKNASRYVSPGYLQHADAAWTQTDGQSAAARAAYGKLSTDLLDALFLIELAVVFPEVVTTKRLQGTGWTKRAEVQLTDAWLGGS